MTGIERTIIEILVGLAVAGGLVLYLEHRGAQGCLNENKAQVAQQETHNEVKAATDAQTINQEALDHAKAIAAAPDPTPALVCVRKYAAPRPLSTPTAPEPVRHDPADSRKADQPPATDDPGPDLVKIGQGADAQIAELQDYIKKVCLGARK